MYDIEVCDRVDAVFHVSDVGVFKCAEHMEYAIHSRDVG